MSRSIQRIIKSIPVVLLLSLGEDEVRHDEGREDDEDRLPDPPESVGKTLGVIGCCY